MYSLMNFHKVNTLGYSTPKSRHGWHCSLFIIPPTWEASLLTSNSGDQFCLFWYFI